MKFSERLIKGVAVALELTGTKLSDPAVKVILAELAAYPEEQVLVAVKRACSELRGRLTLPDILERLPNGHPGAEEAWSICSRCLNDERLTVVWTREMAQAFGVALGLQADPVAARMAFKETYNANIAQARLERRAPVWTVSPGTDKDGRELAILDAVEKGRISVAYAQAVLPYHREEESLNARLLASASGALKRIEAKA